MVDRFVCVSQEINVQVRGDLFLKEGRRGSNRQTGRNSNRLKEGRKKKEIRRKGERNKLLLGFLKFFHGAPDLLSCCSRSNNCMFFVSMFECKLTILLWPSILTREVLARRLAREIHSACMITARNCTARMRNHHLDYKCA